MRAILIFILLVTVLTGHGCAWSPGMKSNISQDQNINLITINAVLINKLKSEKKSHPQPASGLLRHWGNQDRYTYVVGPTDILSIIVWDHPELTIPAGAERSAEQAGTVVKNDGTIFFPFAGIISVEGKTVAQIRSILSAKLDSFIENVKLDVRVAQYNHKRVFVVGEVNQPGVHKITNVAPTLVEMLNQAGGFSPNADPQSVTLTRNGDIFNLNVLAMYESGDTRFNPILEPGDIVNVHDKESTKVYVLGQVKKPGSYYVNKGKKSLAEAMSDAGGVDELTANPAKVVVLRQDTQGRGHTDVFQLNARSPDAFILADQFPLRPRDVVYVDTAPVIRWSRLIQAISGTISTLNDASSTDFPLFNGESR